MLRSNLQTTVGRVGRVVLIASFLAPFAYAPGTFYPEVFGKGFSVVLCATLVTSCFLVLLIARQAWVNEWSREGWAVIGVWIGWIAMFGIFSLTGVDPERSFFGTHLRQTGWLFTFFSGLLVFFVPYFLPTQEDWKFSSALVFFMASAASIFGVLQATGAVPMDWDAHRAQAWFGNPLLFSSVMLWAFFLAVVISFSVRGWRRYAGVVMALFLLTSLVSTGSRSVLVALGVAGLAGIMLAFLTQKNKRSTFWAARRHVLIFLCLVAVCGVIGFGVLTRAHVPLTRLWQPRLEASQGSSRGVVWQMATAAFFARPWLGWGPENFTTAFDRHYDPALFRFGIHEAFWDKPHNAFFEVLVSGGMFMAGMWAVFFGVLLWVLLALFQKGKISRVEYCLWSAAIVAHLVFTFFFFETVGSIVCLALVSARCLFLGQSSTDRLCLGRPRGLLLFGAGAVMILGTWCVVVLSTSNIAASSVRTALRDLVSATTTVRQQGLEERVLDRFSRLDRLSGPYHRELVGAVAHEFLVSQSRVSYQPKFAIAFFQAVESALIADTRDFPDDFGSQYLLGQVQQRLGDSIDSQKRKDAEQSYAEALRLSPGRQPVRLFQAQLQISAGDFAAAYATIDSVIQTAPDFPEAYRYLYLAALSGGDTARVVSATRLYMERGGQFEDMNEGRVLAQMAEENGDINTALAVHERLLEWNPTIRERQEVYVDAQMRLRGLNRVQAEAAVTPFLR